MGSSDYTVPKGRPFIPYGRPFKKIPPGAAAMQQQSTKNYAFDLMRAKRDGVKTKGSYIPLAKKPFKTPAFVKGSISKNTFNRSKYNGKKTFKSIPTNSRKNPWRVWSTSRWAYDKPKAIKSKARLRYYAFKKRAL